ncbi:hypothetical protein BpHYR1_032256 [Brachionus plicatilis]|uniref:Uncharacterized protein n=1 Tax=Brachionus plicatilis TaxID=10195 RepID=A0A3M7QCP2_BRAPC|nr:hypothetical protein BpHYR1_032256 [Brachionus plicatilis]
MSRREAALKARKELEKYKNCNYIKSGESDEEINNENESEDEDNADKSVIYSSDGDEDDDIDDIQEKNPTCEVCLHEQKVEAVCKICHDNGKKL